MSVILILILASLAVALVFLGAFIWSVRSGQYDDTLTPALRMLTDDGTLGAEVSRPTAPASHTANSEHSTAHAPRSRPPASGGLEVERSTLNVECSPDHSA
jgi:cbb3-type cytochrome oxidase maturation protein